VTGRETAFADTWRGTRLRLRVGVGRGRIGDMTWYWRVGGSSCDGSVFAISVAESRGEEIPFLAVGVRVRVRVGVRVRVRVRVRVIGFA